MIISRRLGWAGREARMEEGRSAPRKTSVLFSSLHYFSPVPFLEILIIGYLHVDSHTCYIMWKTRSQYDTLFTISHQFSIYSITV